MKRYKLTFEYDGSHFFGWQKQPDVRTVEGEIEKAFSILYQSDIDIVGQGRTDTGVHAFRQVAHADLPDRFDNQKIKHAMGGLLPHDVALISIKKVHSDFHARFDALSRSYEYQIATIPSPIYRHVSWPYFIEMDEEILKECAKAINGHHDFINFCIPSGDEYQTTNCHITESKWSFRKGFWKYQITGNRFLRHMVRRLVGTMVQVASGREKIDEFNRLVLANESLEANVFTAPAKGLILRKVSYDQQAT